MVGFETNEGGDKELINIQIYVMYYCGLMDSLTTIQRRPSQ